MNNILEIDLTGLVIVTILMIVFISIIFLKGIIINGKSKKTGKPFEVDESLFYLYAIFILITFAFTLAVLICLSIVFGKMKLTPTFDLIFNDPNCVDSYGLDLYQQLVPNIAFIRKSSLAGIILSGAAIIIMMVYTCIGFIITRQSLYE